MADHVSIVQEILNTIIERIDNDDVCFNNSIISHQTTISPSTKPEDMNSSFGSSLSLSSIDWNGFTENSDNAYHLYLRNMERNKPEFSPGSSSWSDSLMDELTPPSLAVSSSELASLLYAEHDMESSSQDTPPPLSQPDLEKDLEISQTKRKRIPVSPEKFEESRKSLKKMQTDQEQSFARVEKKPKEYALIHPLFSQTGDGHLVDMQFQTTSKSWPIIDTTCAGDIRGDHDLMINCAPNLHDKTNEAMNQEHLHLRDWIAKESEEFSPEDDIVFKERTSPIDEDYTFYDESGNGKKVPAMADINTQLDDVAKSDSDSQSPLRSSKPAKLEDDTSFDCRAVPDCDLDESETYVSTLHVEDHKRMGNNWTTYGGIYLLNRAPRVGLSKVNSKSKLHP